MDINKQIAKAEQLTIQPSDYETLERASKEAQTIRMWLFLPGPQSIMLPQLELLELPFSRPDLLLLRVSAVE